MADGAILLNRIVLNIPESRTTVIFESNTCYEIYENLTEDEITRTKNAITAIGCGVSLRLVLRGDTYVFSRSTLTD
jgi:hypothetical protein